MTEAELTQAECGAPFNRSGATIFTNSSAAGGFFTYGTWAATGT